MPDAPKGYLKIKDRAYEQYVQFSLVYCPHLKREVVFTGKGFWHIVYRAKDKKREESAQSLRFRLLSKTLKLLSLTATLQEYDSYTGTMIVKDHGKRVSKVMTLEFFGYIVIIDGWKMKVIVRKDGNGKPYFWSVIPNWVTNKKRDIRFQNYTGDLEGD